MSYAVFEVNGKQFKAGEGDEILVEGVLKKGKIEFDKVLLYTNSESVEIGEPYVTGAKVIGEVLGEEKGKKITVRRYKAKSRYRKKKGHRSKYSSVKISKISLSS